MSLVLAGGVGYHLGNSSEESQDIALRQELEQMRSEAEQAAVVKRVSQQMEEIAYQQKELSDSAAHEAQRQSVLAQNNARKAEEESLRARQAQQEAMIERQHAEREAQVALEAEREAILMRDEAQLQRQKSDRLMFLTIARTLSGLAVTNFDNHNAEIGKVLTLQAYRMLRDGGGNLYTSEMYKAVAQSLGLLQAYNFPTHSYVNDIDVLPPPHVGVVAVSTYGEVVMFTLRKGHVRADQRVLFADKSYYFKSVVPYEDCLVLMDQAGSLYTMTYDGHISEKWQSLNDVKVEYIYRLKNRHLLVKCTDRIIWLNYKNHRRVIEYPCPKPLESLCIQNDDNNSPESIYLFMEGGLCHKIDPIGRLLSEMHLGYDQYCTEAFVDSNDVLFAGLENGQVYHTMSGMKSNVFSNHISEINGIYVQDSICATVAQDHKVCLTDLRLLTSEKEHEWIEPASYTTSGWPLVMAVTCSQNFPMNIIWVGCSNGEVIQMPMLMSEMGKALEKSGIRNMTRSEWSEYVGNNLDYPY